MVERIKSELGCVIERVDNKKECIQVKNEDIKRVSEYLKNRYSYCSVIDIFGTNQECEERSEHNITYVYVNTKHNHRLYVRTSTKAEIASISEVYRSSTWLERELYDMYGVYPVGSKDPRRILTDYGFRGHPLKKGFHVNGYYAIRYDDKKKRIVMEMQE